MTIFIKKNFGKRKPDWRGIGAVQYDGHSLPFKSIDWKLYSREPVGRFYTAKDGMK